MSLAARFVARFVAVVAVVAFSNLVLLGCSSDPPEPDPTSNATTNTGTPGGTASPTATPRTRLPPDAAPTRDDVLRAGTAVTSGPVTVVALVDGTAVEQADGSARLALPAGAGEVVATLAAPDGLAIDALIDDTALVRADEGAQPPVAGIRLTGNGRLVPVGDVVQVVGSAEPQELWLATTAVESADWGEREGGRSLAVSPAAWARGGGSAASTLLGEQLVALEPEAASDTMQQQLTCHEVGAPDKETWNLEPWRPAVGLLAMAAARCNPEP
ncbi:DUF2599 domain-containing protein [Cellulomonas composti]|uniref:DUF2599 domain-containing protein n=1 Tax=Cellulomonas composti TaxID=266130 RepID=A0A511JD68_9CELL|nr:DUF2599 domain-containing protein [Cellulomonas composti]GEL95941.1 hypothetical protein CCO02nite_25990 [Cellulomonas composti]